ncbi:MAG: extensin family protein [Boseongicola sp.]
MIRGISILALATLVSCGGGDPDGDIPSGVVAVKHAPVTGPGGCGVRDAWAVSEVAGVRLSQQAILAPGTMHALETWVRRGAIPAIGGQGGGLRELKVVSHYACRTRNSRSGAKLSEHAKGNAIDIAAFVLRDGSSVTVLDGWHSDDSELLRRLHSSACGTFGTVLGPNADRHHRDHFHFDVASYRGGAHCR